MRALVQRVAEAAVRVDGEIVSEIGPGLLVLICAMEGDESAQAEYLARKIAKMRIFRDDAGRMNQSV
ncbi:D-aminoacyl-tRNA deacylase [Epibacterium ulvae]|nr:D-aminoacyl-tRNA deacylase [Epibacterium ulvae]